jgi:cellulose synthase/poly-beta-1,6-N-acetylglucosamine synthase-like glycosyltransferase
MMDNIKYSQWINHTGLNYLGLILVAIIGSSTLFAAIAFVKNLINWQLLSLLSGIIMLFWIIGKSTSIRQFHQLQAIYLTPIEKSDDKL